MISRGALYTGIISFRQLCPLYTDKTEGDIWCCWQVLCAGYLDRV